MGVSLVDFPAVRPLFKYNGKSRRRHELGHNPPVVVSEDISDATTESTPLPPKNSSMEGVWIFSGGTHLLDRSCQTAIQTCCD